MATRSTKVSFCVGWRAQYNDRSKPLNPFSKGSSISIRMCYTFDSRTKRLPLQNAHTAVGNPGPVRGLRVTNAPSTQRSGPQQGNLKPLLK